MQKTPTKHKNSSQYCLGIESTADDFGVGVSTFEGTILANVTDSYVPVEGGIHPREAARHHAEVASQVLRDALDKAQIKASEL
jgi:N6-L-threonylcarbamoyladenine synthase